MSNLKRSKPDKQDAALKRLQEISSSRAEFENNYEDTLTTSSNLKTNSSDVCEAKEVTSDADNYLALTQETKNSHGQKTGNNLPTESGDSNKTKSNIPDFKITQESDSSNSNSVTSSNNSSPKLCMKNQHGMKGLHSLAIAALSGRRSPQPSPPRVRRTPPYSPKLSGRFENWPELGTVSSSPTSPSRKYFKYLNSPSMFAGGVRRGSEPLLDGITGKDLNEIQLSLTDRRWEKLRSILVAMKNEPFDVNSVVEPPSPDMLNSLKGNIDTQEELAALRKELSNLHTEMELKDCELQQALNERNMALAYIRKLNLSGKELKDDNKNDRLRGDENSDLDVNHNENRKKSNSCEEVTDSMSDVGNITAEDTSVSGYSVYANEIESLKIEESTKEDVMKKLEHVAEDLRVERSYLNHLMSVVLERAPWMLDEVDRGGHWVDDPDTDRGGCSSDDEVWC